MKRFFFDVSTKEHIQYDFRGRDFSEPEQARALAELIALDFECADYGDDLGDVEIQVRNIKGACLFSVPVRPLEMVA